MSVRTDGRGPLAYSPWPDRDHGFRRPNAAFWRARTMPSPIPRAGSSKTYDLRRLVPAGPFGSAPRLGPWPSVLAAGSRLRLSRRRHHPGPQPRRPDPAQPRTPHHPGRLTPTPRRFWTTQEKAGRRGAPTPRRPSTTPSRCLLLYGGAWGLRLIVCSIHRPAARRRPGRGARWGRRGLAAAGPPR
jgi:hypothetical protein